MDGSGWYSLLWPYDQTVAHGKLYKYPDYYLHDHSLSVDVLLIPRFQSSIEEVASGVWYVFVIRGSLGPFLAVG